MSVVGATGVQVPMVPVPAAASAATSGSASASAPASGSAVFGDVLRDVMAREGLAAQQAAQAIQSLAAGQTDNMHAITLAVAQADLQFRLILELRNRFTEAYQEIMRMQI
ncbi:MAG: flagellar hook-basal body complex protein FliE [Gemmataceae bacterium]|nr:flagellar hook-basal body complex protein FliE [Gemmataceae bacterium]